MLWIYDGKNDIGCLFLTYMYVCIYQTQNCNKARLQNCEYCLTVLPNSAYQGVLAYPAVTTEPKLTRLVHHVLYMWLNVWATIICRFQLSPKAVASCTHVTTVMVPITALQLSAGAERQCPSDCHSTYPWETVAEGLFVCPTFPCGVTAPSMNPHISQHTSFIYVASYSCLATLNPQPWTLKPVASNIYPWAHYHAHAPLCLYLHKNTLHTMNTYSSCIAAISGSPHNALHSSSIKYSILYTFHSV